MGWDGKFFLFHEVYEKPGYSADRGTDGGPFDAIFRRAHRLDG